MTKPLQRHTPLDTQFASWPGSLLKRPCTRNCTLRCFPLNSSFQQFLLQQKNKVLEVFEIDYIRGQTFQAYWCKCTSTYLINMLCIEIPYMHRYDPMIRQEDFLLGDVFRTPNQQSKPSIHHFLFFKTRCSLSEAASCHPHTVLVMWATKKPSYFPLYWLFNRDSGLGILIVVCCNPHITG